MSKVFDIGRELPVGEVADRMGIGHRVGAIGSATGGRVGDGVQGR
jgi:hypothetical protein